MREGYEWKICRGRVMESGKELLKRIKGKGSKNNGRGRNIELENE